MEAYKQLEIEWAKWNNLDPEGMVCCASGSAALHLSLEAMQLPPGSKVITGDFNMIAVPRAVTLAGLEPVFVDCGDTLLMDNILLGSEQIYNKESFDTIGAVIVVHIYGRSPTEWSSIEEIKGCRNVDKDSRDSGCYIIEDLAEAHGARPRSFTDAACWSFYKNKIVAGEEGGAVWFRDPAHATLARQLRSLGFTDAHDFDHVPRGHNYRMSNTHASIILEQYNDFYWNHNALDNYREVLFERRKIESWYNRHCPQEWRMPPRDAPWVYDLRVRGITRYTQARVVAKLNAEGIAARHSFKPMHMQREYNDEGLRCKLVSSEMGCYIKSWVAANEVFYLPISPGKTTEADCRRAFEVIREIVLQNA